MNIISISPFKVIPAPWNTRSEISEESVRSLAESIRADGIIQTPNCYRNADGELVCYDGNRRVAAACQIGLDEIEVAVSDITEDEAKVRTVTANLQRENDDPLLAAAVIASMDGDSEVIASKLGKTTAWVKRRAKLNALDDSIKAFVGKVTLEALERISDLDADKQKKLAKKIESRVKYANGVEVKWREISWDAKALTFDLDEAYFCKSECEKCTERTGADWFADGEEGLGRCLNCACFKQREDNHKAGLINSTIPADAEREEVEYRWSLPDEVREEDRKKRDKKHPCAYYWFDGGELSVVWGRSRKTIEAEAEADKAEREAEREAEVAERNRSIKVRDALGNIIEDRAACFCQEVKTACGNSQLVEVIEEAFAEYLDSYLTDKQAADIALAFNICDEEAGVEPGDIEWFYKSTRDDDAE